MTSPYLLIRIFGLCTAATVGVGATLPVAALAQDAPPAASADYIEALKLCRAIGDPGERLACYDAKAGEIVAASDAGDVRIIDREDLRQTRRQLFGFTVPEIEILKGDDQDKEASERFETTITSARQFSSKGWRFTTAEGAIWEINNAPARLAPIKGGEAVEFKKASLGFFFIRINGQMGVKGKRVQ
jgi:hypothetical protein